MLVLMGFTWLFVRLGVKPKEDINMAITDLLKQMEIKQSECRELLNAVGNVMDDVGIDGTEIEIGELPMMEKLYNIMQDSFDKGYDVRVSWDKMGELISELRIVLENK